MSKVVIKFKPSICESKVDLTDYGYGEDTKWEELSEDEQHEIEDQERLQVVILTDVTTSN